MRRKEWTRALDRATKENFAEVSRTQSAHTRGYVLPPPASGPTARQSFPPAPPIASRSLACSDRYTSQRLSRPPLGCVRRQVREVALGLLFTIYVERSMFSR